VAPDRISVACAAVKPSEELAKLAVVLPSSVLIVMPERAFAGCEYAATVPTLGSVSLSAYGDVAVLSSGVSRNTDTL